MSMIGCKGCGACCRKGGPTLHLEDMALIRRGVLPLEALVTLRAGELARDDVAGTLLPLEEETVKIAGTGESDAPWHCRFHDRDGRCGIYVHRPAQCRALLCADTSALEQLYTRARATRAHVLACAPEGWRELAEAHEEQCALEPLLSPARHAGRDAEAAAVLLEAVRYDLAFRELSVERAGVPSAALPCLLGRPLIVFLEAFGLAVLRGESGALHIKRIGPSRYPE